MRVKIFTAAEKWDYIAEVANGLCRMLPDSAFGPLQLAHALRKLGRTAEAPTPCCRLPTGWHVWFQLACCCCKLGLKKDALRWLQMAIDVAGRQEIKVQPLDRPDLESGWRDLEESWHVKVSLSSRHLC